ncbi:MAG: DNA-3-methyladenine glycosylase, partial [Bacteroidota bacterium]
PDLFEALCWAIMGQQINLPFAYQLRRRVIEQYGEAFEWDGSVYWFFPQPKDVLRASVEELMELKLTRRKSEYVLGVAELLESGTLSKAQLLTLPDPTAIEKHLVRIRGIGPWTAQYIALRCLRHPDAWPTGDVGLQNAVKRALQMERKATQEELNELGEAWIGWRSYATFYLWNGW